MIQKPRSWIVASILIPVTYLSKLHWRYHQLARWVQATELVKCSNKSLALIFACPYEVDNSVVLSVLHVVMMRTHTFRGPYSSLIQSFSLLSLDQIRAAVGCRQQVGSNSPVLTWEQEVRKAVRSFLAASIIWFMECAYPAWLLGSTGQYAMHALHPFLSVA
jgi:hypothetical protein